ncbi:MAG: hypothetical protein IIY49_10465 [Eubacterium sp.]|nr:hypothetical protein [Eubacterium sp.]
MSPNDAEKYNKWCTECEKGIHNNHPGLGRNEKGQTYALNENNALTYKSFEKETFSSGFDYESMYEQQYLGDISFKY